MKILLWLALSILSFSHCFSQSAQLKTTRQFYDAFNAAENNGDVNQLKRILPKVQALLNNKNSLSQQDQGLLLIVEGGILLDIGNYSLSLPSLKKADSICALAFPPSSPEALQAKRILSWSYGYNSHPELERKLSFDLLSIYSTNKQKNILEIDDLYHTIGFNYGNEGNRFEEQKLYKDGLQLLETFTAQNEEQKNGKTYTLGLIYNSLSISQYANNNYEAALQNARKSLYYRNQVMPGSPQLSTNWMIIGRSLYQTEGNVDSAVFYLNKAIALLEQKDKEGNSLKGSKYWVTYKGYKADILQKANRTNEAIGETQSIITFLQKNKAPETETGLIPSYCSLSAAFLQKGDNKEALAVMQSLKNKTDNNSTLPKLLQIKMNTQFAVALNQSDKYDSAAIVFSDLIHQTGLSLSQLEQNSFSIPVTVPFEFLSVYMQAADAITAHAFSTHDNTPLLKGINVYRNVIAALQARQSWYFEAGVEENIGSEDLNVYEKLLNTLYEAKGKINEALRLHYAFATIESSKANLLKSGLRQDQYFSTVLSKEENIKRIDLKTAMYAAMKKGNELSSSGSQDTLIKAKEHYLTYLQLLKKKYPVPYNANQFNISETDPLLLQSKSTIINYFLGNQNLYSFIFQNGEGNFNRKKLFPHLNETIAFLRQKHGRETDSFFTVSHALYNWLLGDSKLSNELIIIPHKELSLISFDLLNTGAQASRNQYLIEKCPVRYAYSASLLASSDNNKKESASRYFGGFAASQFSNTAASQWLAVNTTNEKNRDNTEPLAGTEKEVTAIADMLDGDIYLHAKSNNFLSHASDYRILHLATHAFADDDNQHQSHFLFETDLSGNSMISGDEIAALPIHAEMAVLSACNTGSGKMNNNEGPMSLGRAFYIAGCPSIVMSLWSVNDESTSEIMTAFYKHLQNGELKDEALRNAKLDYISQQTNPAKKEPYYWAGFVVMGDNSAIRKEQLISSLQWILLITIAITLIGVLIFYFRKRSSSSLT